jgi:hypothetical protein
MIAGRLTPNPGAFDLPRYRPAATDMSSGAKTAILRVAENVHVECFHRDAATGDWLLLAGHPLFSAAPEAPGAQSNASRHLLSLLKAGGLDALGSVDGAFAFAWWQHSAATLWLQGWRADIRLGSQGSACFTAG